MRGDDMTELILVCEDLFGLEVLELIRQINKRSQTGPVYRVLGYLSDREDPFGDVPCSLERLGTISDWMPAGEAKFALGIREPASKRRAVETLTGRGGKFATILSNWMLAPYMKYGVGNVVSAYCIKDGVKFGDYVTVMDAMITNHEIGDFSTVMRFTNLAGDSIGHDTYVGNHVFLAVGKSIGDNCRVADGSIVVMNVKDGMSVSGVPARRRREKKPQG